MIRRRSLWVLVALLAGGAIAYHIVMLTRSADESAHELATAQEQAENLRRSLEEVRAELARERQQRQRTLREASGLQARLERQALIDEIPRVLERVRHLPLRRPLRVRWVDREFTQKFMRQSLAEQLPPAKRVPYVATLVKLGLLPA